MSDRLHLALEGFEGPMDLLLDLAQKQKVDWARLSIVSIVDQYLAIVAGVRLELAADWLVMAAWLTWLKSRLLAPDLLPADAEQAAGLLAERLQDLAAARALAAWLDARPVLGRDVHARGAPEQLVAVDRSAVTLRLPSLLRAYAAQRPARRYAPGRPALWTMQDALRRLRAMLGPGWSDIVAFLPPACLPPASTPLARRAALASTLLAGLELARDGVLELRQECAFAAVECRAC